MPYKVGTKKLYRKKKNYRTKKTFVPKTLAVKRSQQISTKTFYFKDQGQLAGNPDFNLQSAWSTLLYQPGQPQPVPNIPGDFNVISRGYQQYKILAIKLVLYAANVGSEDFNSTNRGITCIYKDQQYVRGQPAPNQVLEVINLGSAKVIPSRVSKWTTVIYRPKGNPEWGNCDIDSPNPQKVPDSWSAAIQLVANGVSNDLLWYWTANYKVVFRGRAYGGTAP